MTIEIEVLASIIWSTWDRITPQLRGIAYAVTDSTLQARFIYEDQPSAFVTELVSLAETECIADFWQSHEVSYFAESLPTRRPRSLHEGEHWAYLRYERGVET
jgi:hypothetical protein